MIGLGDEDEEIKVAAGTDLRISDNVKGWFSHLVLVFFEFFYLSVFISCLSFLSVVFFSNSSIFDSLW
jgi:hypothetical protein